jgi:hypothetical protein
MPRTSLIFVAEPVDTRTNQGKARTVIDEPIDDTHSATTIARIEVDAMRLVSSSFIRLLRRRRGVDPAAYHRAVVTLDEVCRVARSLPRSYEAVVHGRIKFRVGSIVWLAFSCDETVLGFAFPKEWRHALVDSNPDKFIMPRKTDLRYNWAEVRLAAIDGSEMRELVVEAWSIVVPKYVVEEYLRLERSTPHE